MSKKLRITLAQLNFTVGDIQYNLARHIAAAIEARDQLHADIIVFPELSLTGYPPEDLLLRPDFILSAQSACEQLCQAVEGIYCIVGYPHLGPQGLFNAAAILYNGRIIGQYAKQHLPNYGVFDEKRYFIPGELPLVLNIKDVNIGIIICEDIWRGEPIAQCKAAGAEVIVILNASPFETNKHQQRQLILKTRAQESNLPLMYCNMVGAQDELVFDGGSMAVNAKGEITTFANFFQENLLLCALPLPHLNLPAIALDILPKEARIYQALVLGIKDYITKNKFSGVLLGLSGGIDSALTLALAVDALGKEQVKALLMPSQYTQTMSMEDALLEAQCLEVETEIIAIESFYHAFATELNIKAKTSNVDIVLQNLQARIRGLILMARSNTTGYLVLTTGNRSEMAVGYCTLYGDMVGGFAPLKDIPKTLVYALANYRNQISAVIPARVIERAPTAELAPNQTDQDSLPPYPILDAILEAYLNQRLGIAQIVAKGFDKHIVEQVINLVHKNEYKRYQAAPGPHINHQSFGKDWRYPLTNKYRSD